MFKTNSRAFHAAAALAVSLIGKTTCLAVVPPNDNCSSATLISGTAFETTFDISQATTQSCEAASACDAGSSRSVWYRITVPADGRLWADVHSDSPFENFAVSIFDGCAASLFGQCVQPQEIGCAVSEPTSAGTLAMAHVNAQANQTYLIKVAVKQGFGIGTLDVEFHPWVLNEQCADATLIPPGGMNTTQDIILSDFNSCELSLTTHCVPFTLFMYVNAVWYRYDAVADGVLHVEATGADSEQSITVYNGCPFDAPPLGCSHPDEIACDLGDADEPAILDLPVTAGQTYLFWIIESNFEPAAMLSFAAAFVPANDSCGQATIIGAPSFHPAPQPIWGASNSQHEPEQSCDTALFGTDNSVYFRYTPAADGLATIDTIGSNFDTVLSVYNGCGTIILPGNGWIPPAELACNNDIGGLFGTTSRIANFPMLQGQAYVMKVAFNGLDAPITAMLDFNFEFDPEPLCPSDIAPQPAGNGIVNIEDLLLVIATWGTAGAGDVNGNGTVNIQDLLAVIAAWGACP